MTIVGQLEAQNLPGGKGACEGVGRRGEPGRGRMEEGEERETENILSLEGGIGPSDSVAESHSHCRLGSDSTLLSITRLLSAREEVEHTMFASLSLLG